MKYNYIQQNEQRRTERVKVLHRNDMSVTEKVDNIINAQNYLDRKHEEKINRRVGVISWLVIAGLSFFISLVEYWTRN